MRTHLKRLSFSYILSSLFLFILAGTALQIPVESIAAEAAELRGMITDQATKLPIDAVQVTVHTTERSYTARTDGFGMYAIEGIEPGSYTIEANHPGYHSASDTDFSVVAGGRYQWHKELTLKEPFFDIFVEVACVTTGMKLANVPVRITGTPSGSGTAVDRSGKTDSLGFIQFAGLPPGFYNFSINEGLESKPGWESYSEQISKELTSPHWADVLLKPDTSYIVASVYGFNPVTEEENVPLEGIIVECEGVHPEDPDIVLVPARIGVSGIRKENEPYWDNTMAGKVRFTGLPPVHWNVQGKRLGYNVKTALVTALPQENLRIDMTLQNTALTVVVDTPYHDPEMLDGLEVRLQGLKDSNTAGIDRVRAVIYEADNNRAVAIFDKILPGNYLATVNDTVERHVPILIEGNDINAETAYSYSTFSVTLAAADYLDAVADVNRETTLFCTPEPVTFTARLMLADELASHDFDFFRAAQPAYYPGANKILEIRASEYYAQHMPEEYRLIEVQTNEIGEFTLSLVPGMYGITAPGLADYWGDCFVGEDLDSGSYISMMWPYYQVWPHSLKSAQSFQKAQMMGRITSIGGVALSSGRRIAGTLYALKNRCAVEAVVEPPLVWKSPTEHQVVALDRSQAESEGSVMMPEVRYDTLYAEMADGGSITLSGPVTRTEALENRKGMARRVIEGLPAGAYTMALSHPRYAHLAAVYAAAYPYEFTFADFPAPGLVPEAPFPENYDYWKSVFPMGVLNLKGIMQATNYGTAKVEIYSWQQVDQDVYEYVYYSEAIPQFIRPDYAGGGIFYYRQDWRAGTPNTPYEMWLYVDNGYFDDSNEHWYHFTSSGGTLEARINIGGPAPTPGVDPLAVSHDILVETRDAVDGSAIDNIQVSWFDKGPWEEDRTQITTTGGAWVTDLTSPLEFYDIAAEHTNWRYNGYRLETVDITGGKLRFKMVVNMIRGIALRGAVKSAASGNPVEGAEIRLWNRYGRFCERGDPTGADGAFAWPFEMGDVGWFLEVTTPGYEPLRKRLDPSMAVSDPADPRTNAYLFEGDNAIALTPIKQPVIAKESLAMNRRGAFLPGAKKAGNQTAFTAFDAEGPLTMTWSLDVGLEQRTYSVTLPGFDNGDGSAGTNQTLTLQDDIREVWLVDMKAFPNNRYDDAPVALNLAETAEPREIAAFLNNIRGGAEGYKNVYYQRLTNFTAAADQNTVKATGQVKLWQLPPDLFKPAFIVVTKLGAVNVYNFEYTGTFEGKELTGARLPPWFAGMADIMGSVAGSQAMLGEGLQNALPKGKIIALPTFTANIILRATNALDYVYSIDTQVKEGMQSKIGGILGLSPGFMGLSLYGGIEATLKGEDREFYVQMKGGIGKNTVNKSEYTPGFLKKFGDVKVGLTPPPAGEFYHIDSYKFAPDNKPDELAVLYGMSGQAGVEVSASIFPVLKYVPKIGPVLLLLYKSGAMDVRALTKGLIGVRSLSGFKTVFPRQEEHYTIQGAETKQWRRHFLGGNEVGDPVNANDPQKTESLDIAFGFGVGMDAMLARGSVGAKGTVELAGDDAWTGAPAMLIDVNPNGDSPIFRRIRGDLRAVLNVYLKTWIAQLQKKWHWKAWPIDYQFGTESVMYLIEMEIITARRDLGTFAPAQFLGQDPLVVDGFPPLGVFATDGTKGDMLLYTDTTAEGNAALKASLRSESGAWGTPVQIAVVEGAVTDVDVLALSDGTWLAAWTQIESGQTDNPYPPSRIMYSFGNAEGTQWSAPAEAAALPDVAANLKLIPHGTAVALIYSRAADGATGGYQGIYGMVSTGAAWSDPVELASAGIARFDALGSGDFEVKPSLITFITDTRELYTVSWTETPSSPAILQGPVGNALAIGGGNDFAYLACSGQYGGIGMYEYDRQSSEWTDLGILFPEAVPRELSLALTEEGGIQMVTVAWTQSDGGSAGLFYGAVDVLNHEVLCSSKAVEVEGDFRTLLIYRSGTGALHVRSLFESPDGVNQIRDYPLTGLIDYGDINADGIVDLADFITILKILVNDGQFSIPGVVKADANRTGKIDLGDAIHVLKTVAAQ
ncbi:MAG: carboxypeptidase regulatory-like domain-containing protein [Syntrophales bacterium]|nr:carboxypeptidase regulatory-like domain-containing protein [Syntrophales bacterium]